MASTSAAARSASSFPALLRRSKFATFDPTIAQVYTSPDGDNARGNWGLKRPLALKRRRAFITVRTVDTRDKFTDWDPAQHEALFTKKFAEVGRVDAVREHSSWAEQLGAGQLDRTPADSDFALGTAAGDEWVHLYRTKRELDEERKKEVWARESKLTDELLDAKIAEAAAKLAAEEAKNWHVAPRGLIPNTDAMSPRDFDAYVARTRRLRPKFLEYLKSEQARTASDLNLSADPLMQYMRNRQTYRRFLSEGAAARARNPARTRLERQPHWSAGLTYAPAAPLGEYFHKKTYSGRVLQAVSEGRDGTTYVAAYAGLTPRLDGRDGAVGSTVDFGSARGPRAHADWGVLPMRLERVDLGRAPQVVGRRTWAAGLPGAQLEMRARAWVESGMARGVNAVPGSREYVGAEPPADRTAVKPMASGLGGKKRRSVAQAVEQSEEVQKAGNTKFLSNLRRMVDPTPRPDPR